MKLMVLCWGAENVLKDLKTPDLLRRVLCFVHWWLLQPQRPSHCDGVHRPEWICCVQHWSGNASWYNQFSITVDRWWIICICANTLENIMSLTICAFKIELPTRRCAVSMYVGTWGLNFIIAQWLISSLGAQINYHILSTRTRTGTGCVKMLVISLAKSRFLELQLSPLQILFGTY